MVGRANRARAAGGARAEPVCACFWYFQGETRKSGWEYLWEAGMKQPIMPDAHDEGFRLLQLVRDEAHRFAITGHRKARAKVAATVMWKN